MQPSKYDMLAHVYDDVPEALQMFKIQISNIKFLILIAI